MNKHWLWFIVVLLVLFPRAAGAQGKTSAQINGSLSSNADLQNERLFPDPDNSEEPESYLNWGWSNFANLRFKSQVNENLSFYLAVNLNALTGFYAEMAAVNFLAGLERLYFKAGNDWLDVEAGLIRIPRGYGFAFSPLDMFHPRDATNSLDPQGRPKGKWGIHATFYPQDMWKVEFFGLAPDDFMEKEGWDSKFGLATNFSLGKINWDLLYGLFLPEIPYGTTPGLGYENNDFTHVTGFALKADIEIGLFAEALYRFEHRALKTGLYYGDELKWYNALEAVLGVDYTLPNIDMYLLAEYLFFGSGHVDWDESLDVLYTSSDWDETKPLHRLPARDSGKKPLAYARHDYLFVMARYSVNQDFRLGASVLMGLDDLSGLLTAFLEYDVIQGLTLQTSFLLPFDKQVFDKTADPGEFGSTSLGFYQLLRLGAKVKF